MHEQSPETINIIDTQDLHFLRRARQKSINTGEPLNLQTDDAIREISAILRSDLSLIISTFELNLLIDEFNISPALLHY